MMRLIVCQIDLLHDLHHNMYGGSWSIPDFADFCIPYSEETLMWKFICFEFFFLEYMIGSYG